MKRRELLGGLAGAAALRPGAGSAQQAQSLPTVAIAFASVEGDPESLQRARSFQAGMRDLGWIDGQTVRFAGRWMGNDPARARTVADDLVALKPDVILTMGTVAATALRAATKSIPVVFVNVTDPVAGGYVASLARPGGNMTGFTPFEYPIAGKWLALLKQAAPGLSRVALMGDPNNHNYRGFWGPFETTAQGLGIQPLKLPVGSAAEIEKGLEDLAAAPGGGVVVSAATFSLAHRELIFALTARLRLPAIYWTRFFAATGGLMSYGPDTDELYAKSAAYVSRILKGAHPADLPVQTATRFETVINLRTARALGLQIAPSLASSADETIE